MGNIFTEYFTESQLTYVLRELLQAYLKQGVTWIFVFHTFLWILPVLNDHHIGKDVRFSVKISTLKYFPLCIGANV